MEDDAEDGQRMRFSMEADFEGGEWIGGEYFYAKKKHKRMQTREDALYGVFNESDSDGEGGGKGRRRRKDDDVISKGNLSKPVAFVSKGVTNPNQDLEEQQQQKNRQQQEEGLKQGLDEEAEGGAPRVGLGFSGLGAGTRPGLGGNGVGAQEEQGEGGEGDEEAYSNSAFAQVIQERAERRRESERERARGERKAKALGKSTERWAAEASLSAGKSSKEMSKYGIGLRMLEKMGYKGGGLGRNEQGISAPIEAKMRPKNMGMGFGDFREKEVGLPARPGDETASEEAAEFSQVPVSSVQVKEKEWKKRGKGKKKVEYKTAAQLLEERQAAGKEVSQTILDMRGTQVRVLTSLENLNEQGKSQEDDVPMPELQHNLRLLVDLAEADIQSIDQKLRGQRAALEALQGEKEQVVAKAKEQQRQLKSMESIVRTLDNVQEARAILDSNDVIARFRALKEEFPEEYKLFNVPVVALSHAQPQISTFFKGWNPLAAPRHGVLEVAMWREVLVPPGHDESDRAIFADSALSDAADQYALLVANSVLPPVRSAITNMWEPRDPEPLLRFLEDWKGTLPDALVRDVLTSLVLPKLAAAVNDWNPLKETIPIHQWVHPWLPYLGSSLQGLYATIQYRLGLVLGAWHPSDSSALAMLSPWRTVFEPSSWDALLSRTIVPKLIETLRAEFVVNPQQQVLDPFRWVMSWAGTLPAHHMVAILDMGFFPQWHQVLYHWLCATPNFDEVTRWYLGWKATFPEDLLALERVRQQFNVALDMMNQAVEGMPVVQPGARENVSYLRVTELQSFAEREGKAGARGNKPKVAAMDVEMEMGVSASDMSLKEMVEMFAQQHDVKFLPKPGRMHEGLPVYGFGTVSMVADSAKQIVFAQNENHEWEPVSLENLLDMHRKRGGRWAV